MASSATKPKAYLCRRFTDNVEEALRARYELRVNQDDGILPPEDIAQLAQGSQVLFVSATEQINASVLRRLAPTLRYVATLSVGYDHIDMAAARELGVGVLHTPDVLSDACAEIAMMLMLNACRRGYEADRMVRSGGWTGWSPTQLLGKGLKGKRAVVFGMGRIGREIAARARAFGMEIHYHNRRRLPPEQEAGATYHATLDDALRLADVLISALSTGRLFAAGLDVFANEPAIDPRYRDLDNVFLSPHIGSATKETRDAMGWLLIDGLDALLQGRRPDNLLIPANNHSTETIQ